ncbi:MAG TPA: polysaccharide deacetylase family protein [Dehalococcoidia bacterium]|nr:polysaccharide deacetylase family protein [Dehalococcoidia bacterium]
MPLARLAVSLCVAVATSAALALGAGPPVKAAARPGHPPARAAARQAWIADGGEGVPASASMPAATPAQQNVTGRPPNELGRVLIMEYHRIWNPEAPWQRSPAGFRRDLERLYAAGFRSVPLRDVLANRIDLPPGTSPVVFTFDDSYVSQLWFAADGQPAADSAVGIMQRFAAEHPDFGLHGVFYITWNTLFGAPGAQSTDRLRYLVDHGFELGNHTLSHPDLSRGTAASVQKELGQEQAYVRQALGGYEMQTLALPFGNWPRDRSLARTGDGGDGAYRFEAILQVGSEPAPAPATAAYNPLVLPRVQAGEQLLSYWLAWFDQHPDERYVSDGDPACVAFPARLAGRLRPDAAQRWTLRSY